MDERGPTFAPALLLTALAGVVLLAAGCSRWRTGPTGPRGAAEHFGPVGPVALLAHAPRPETGEPARTAVHLAGRRSEPAAVVPDSKIRLDVGLKLEDSPLRLSQVEVLVEDQRVRLVGAVPDLRARDRAELIARAVTGVRGVDNQLTVESFPEAADSAADSVPDSVAD